MKKTKYQLTIGWLYPTLMNTYGDRGNILVLQKRAQWRDIDVKIERISPNSNSNLISTCDLFFMGGAQDTQQEIVNLDLLGSKGNVLLNALKMGIPGLFICGGYQFLGRHYITSENVKIKGLGFFDMYTQSPKNQQTRLVGNCVMTVKNKDLNISDVLGFENHNGRTYLSNNSQSFATVISGNGNNGEDKTEGIIFKNSIGTYLHGPILPKNPQIADFLIAKALEIKYKKSIKLESLDDSLEIKAKIKILKGINQ